HDFFGDLPQPMRARRREQVREPFHLARAVWMLMRDRAQITRFSVARARAIEITFAALLELVEEFERLLIVRARHLMRARVVDSVDRVEIEPAAAKNGIERMAVEIGRPV